MSETPSEQDAPSGPTRQQVSALAEQIGHLAIAAEIHSVGQNPEAADAARGAMWAHLDYTLTLLGMKRLTTSGGD